MACFQIKATLGNGATVLFGVQAKDGDSARCAALASLSRFMHAVAGLQVLELAGDRWLTRGDDR
jgi:hypothetical protein